MLITPGFRSTDPSELILHAEGLWGRNPCTDPQWVSNPYSTLQRCRKCTNCLEDKQLKWKARSKEEHKKWSKHWLVTLTYRNVRQYDYEKVQLWLKRVRKTHPAPLSYICCTEFNSKGRRSYHPHHHLIVHSNDDLLWSELNEMWDYGHFHAELLKRKDAYYVTKYLAKDATARIRASKNYGTHIPQPLLKKLYTEHKLTNNHKH